ncbi:MAG: hypothetical protein ABJH52_08965 [Henriciella sp.]
MTPNIKAALIAASALALLPTAAAQVAEDAITTCAQSDTAAARITCLETALRSFDTAPQAPRAQAAPAQAAQAAPAPVITEAALSPVEAMGIEQVIPREAKAAATKERTERVAVTVASTRTVPVNKLEITLSNGQVWRQTKGDSRTIRVSKKLKNELTAELWRGPVSGYKMKINELRKTLRVERVK